MEADLSRYHRLDLADFYRGRLSLRRLRSLLRWLPPESAVWTVETERAEKAEAAQQVADIQGVLDTFQR